MSSALWPIRLILMGVFVVSAVTKLSDRHGARQGIVDFGLPARLASPLATWLPVVEGGVAITLLSPWARCGALAALGLLGSFTGAILANLLRGRKPECHCFGQLHSRPVGWGTVLRNVILAAGATAVVFLLPWEAPSIMATWVSDLSPLELLSGMVALVTVALVLFHTFMMINLVRQNGRLLLRVEALEKQPRADAPSNGLRTDASGLPVGAEAPGFTLPGIHGEKLTLDFLRGANRSVLLLFSDPDCGPCNALLPEIASWQHQFADRLTVTLISRGSIEANRAKAAQYGLTNVLIQNDGEVSSAYQEAGTPSAVLVRPDGTIASSLVPGAEEIRRLVAQVVHEDARHPVLPMVAAEIPQVVASEATRAPARPTVGDPAPEIRLPDLKGRDVSLASFRGRKTVVIFWNPSCGFCQQMLDALRNWELQRRKDSPSLLIVSTGTVAENRRMGLKSPVLIDPDFSAATAFGANGTPMAILVDEAGKIASELAAGAPAVLALTRNEASFEGPVLNP